MSLTPLKARSRAFLPCAAVLLLSAMSRGAGAATYEVATTGSDANAGSAAAPLKTIQKAANIMHAGDTVLINDGTYAGFRMRTSGTAAARITFKSKHKWGARITAANPSADADFVTVLSASYVTIDGIEVSNSTRAGIGVRTLEDETGADTRDDIVQNCYCHDNGLPSGGAHDGIFTGFALNFTAQNNVCDHNGEHGIYVSNSADNPIVRGNVCSNNRNCGVQFNADLSSQIDGNADGLISNWLIQNNVIFGNGAGGGSAINLDGDINGICRNNLLYNNTSTGIALYAIDGAEASHNNLIVNNTIYEPNSNRSGLVLAEDANNNTVFNNVFIAKVGIETETVSGFVHDYNIVNGYDGPSASAHEKSATGAGLFVNPASDFHLATNSPALNAGVGTFGSETAPAVDIDGAARPAGGAFDIGCYESGATTGPTPTPTPTSTPQPGTLKFAVATSMVNEGAGTATITVQRVGGTDGVVGVHYATTTGGTATAGTDYTAVAGNLSFAAGDATAKTFTVHIVNDTADEANETINLLLSTPTGDATLDSTLFKSVLTIVDNDQADTTASTVAFVSPVNNSFVAGLNTINGTAADTGSGLFKVTLQIRRLGDGLYWNGTAWAAPAKELPTVLASGKWSRGSGNPAGALLPTVQYAIRAYAYDNAGNRGAVISLTTVDRAAPRMTLDTPAANAHLSKLPAISGTATDDSGVTRVALSIQRLRDGFYWSGTKWGSISVSLEATITGSSWTLKSGLPPEFLVASSKQPPDGYRIFAHAHDGAGKSVAVTRDFTLGGTPPGGISGGFAMIPGREWVG